MARVVAWYISYLAINSHNQPGKITQRERGCCVHSLHLFGKPIAIRQWCKQATLAIHCLRLAAFVFPLDKHPQPAARCSAPDQSTKRIINEDCHIKKPKQKATKRTLPANEITWRAAFGFASVLRPLPLVWLLIMATAATPTINFRYIQVYIYVYISVYIRYKHTGMPGKICMFARGGYSLARLHIHGSSHY